jgi:biopolymer transport protein ExbB
MRLSRILLGAAVATLLLPAFTVQAQQAQAPKVQPPQQSGGASPVAVAPVAAPAKVAPIAPAAPSVPAPVAAVPPDTSAAAPPSAAAAPQDISRSLAIGPLRELSARSMFMSADWVVKAVILSLIFASLATWTILIAKTAQLFRASRQLGDNLSRIADCRSLGEAQLALGSKDSILVALLTSAAQEIRMSADSGSEGGIKERTASRFSEITKLEARSIRYGMGLIATIGATAPFVGLFGTVWGIMNSFIGISKAQTTNLAVVAPGIAEALLATAVGLAAAIPAVIIYNYFSRATKGYLDLVGRGTGAVGRLLSRDIDRFQARAISAAAE